MKHEKMFDDEDGSFFRSIIHDLWETKSMNKNVQSPNEPTLQNSQVRWLKDSISGVLVSPIFVSQEQRRKNTQRIKNEDFYDGHPIPLWSML